MKGSVWELIGNPRIIKLGPNVATHIKENMGLDMFPETDLEIFIMDETQNPGGL